MTTQHFQPDQTPIAIGIDVGGTNVRLGVFAGTECLKQIRFNDDFANICAQHSPVQAWQQILDLLVAHIAQLHADFPTVMRVGLGFPGFIDPITNVIESSPNLPGLKNVNLAADLSQALQQHSLALTVNVANDANVAALGEYHLAGAPAGGLIYCGLGTGVGGGLILNGQIYAGNHGCAMEIGHIIVESNGRQCGCGNLGCLETYASATGIVNTYQQYTGQQTSAAKLAKLAESGDQAAQAAYTIAAQTLAQAIASVLKVVDVRVVLIGGGVAGAWHLMQAPFDARLSTDLIPVLRDKILVKVDSGSDLAAMIGAAQINA